MSNAAPAQDETPKKKKGIGMLFVALGLVLGLGGGGGAYWFYFMRPPAAPAKPVPPKTGIIAMEPFVVNLADEGGGRFLRVTLSLVVEGEKDDNEGKESPEQAVVNARLRSAILERLAQQTADHLVTPEGKAELKKTIAEQAARAAHELKVTDVLFSEFVVQF
jgi:flagellar FliL protein